MSGNSLILRSGQGWKLLAGGTALVIGFGGMVFGLQELREPRGIAFALGGMAIGILAMVLTCLLIRCETCGMRWVWAAVRNQDHQQWVNWLVAQRVCPRCGYDPDAQARPSAT